MEHVLPDGRVVAWAEFGDPAGRPVSYLDGTPGSRLWSPPESALDGIRLFTMDRPGYGRSDAVRRPTLLGVADTVSALMTAVDVPRFGVVGHSGGAPYALACGARFPDRLTGVVASALTGPDRELGTVRGKQRRQVWLLRTVPGLGRRFVTRAAAFYAQDPLAMHRQQLASGNDRWMTPQEESKLEGARQGAAGLIADWLATDIHRWGFALRDVRARTLVFAGRHDPGRAAPDAPMVVARIAGAELRIDEEAGHTPSPAGWRDLLSWAAGAPG
ncbi:alpha/beta hydrolase [Asanoa sp. WMMD1127]|uniref:alpha/beta fold hydrolase n=1 Tax=Asanoa sp. WMMD1127 TaxID=3016107 RepID=UPI0024173C57|nr:alpha/beta hydrolase [Asanoa sp. WMMD1127]MDG4820597.1 alpha/beta hydrolase [Asanoa sp. WMMD1127]